MPPKIDPFQIVRRGTLKEFREVVDAVGIEQTNDIGESLLHEAIAYQNNEVALDLIGRGIDINRQTKKGLTPLHYAASHSNFLLAGALLDRNADLTLQDMHGNQPLWTAVLAARNDLSLVKRLVKQSADPKHENKYGKSPLSLATEMNDQELLSILRNVNSRANHRTRGTNEK